MADVEYTSTSNAPSGTAWTDAFIWLNAHVENGGTEAFVTNADGSITKFIGTGLALDPLSGTPSAGMVTEVERISPDGNTEYEKYEFVAAPLQFSDLYLFGIGTWFLGGNDRFSIIGGTPTIVEDSGAGADLVEVRNNVPSFVLPDNIENLLHAFFLGNFKGTGNALDNQLLGGVDKDTLIGLGGQDNLDGRAGIDTLIGGKGNDIYIVQDAGDKIIELKGQGTDQVTANLATYTLAANVENLFADSVLGVNFTGNALSNQITGSYGVDTLRGLNGNDKLDGDGNGGVHQADTLIGSKGNDTYIVDDAGDVVVERAKQGTDTVFSELTTYSLAALKNIENITFSDAAAFSTGTGNARNNTLTAGQNGADLSGLGGNDTLVGFIGGNASMLHGGLGNDTYIVGNVADTLFENDGEGTDRALVKYHSNVTYTLGDFVENGAIIDGIVGENRFLTGNGLNNKLTGSISDDTLDGSAGKDKMAGGKGDDTYVVDSALDVVTELAGQGHDKVKTTLTAYTLGDNVEDLEFTDGAIHTGIGNNLDNIISSTALLGAGDTLKGLGGNDTLSGGENHDILIGGKGDDTYIIHQATDVTDDTIELANEGTDTILTDIDTGFGFVDLADAKYANIENLIGLIPSLAYDFRGNSLDNNLSGGDFLDHLTGNGGDDTLIGNADGFADVLRGGQGDDTYIVDELGEDIQELTGQGTDTIKTTLATFVMPVAIGTTEFENLIFTGITSFTGTGNSLANTIVGGDLGDTLDGGTNADTLIGGKGDDTYKVDNAGDQVTEKLNEGTDTVETSLAIYTLGANVENLTYSPIVAAIFAGTGNKLNNILIGGTLADTLTGLDGDDRLDGGGGVDTMIGGKGNDTYVVDDLSDVVTELASQGIDTIEISATGGIALAANVENLTYTGSSNWTGIGGNTLNNIITGGNFGNDIDGLAGNDTLIGGNLVDTLEGDAGNDTLIGGGSADILDGGDDNDILDGGTGDDTMVGGNGNDLYKVDSVGDVINEQSGQGTGIDTIETTVASMMFTVAGNIEIIKFTGSGNFLVIGSAGDNTITGGAGNDSLEDGGGTDTLIGGNGDDTYIVHSLTDKTVETLNQGTDTVKTDLLTYTLGAHVENLEFTGSGQFNGTGNGLDNRISGGSSVDTLSGLGGNDRLFGGTDDILIGGKGDDVYIIDGVLGVTVTELANQGTDTVATSLDFHTLAANVENLFYTGSGTFHGTGNAGNNIIVGGTDNDILEGLGGNDTLFGGLGDDTFRFADGGGRDIVQDFAGAGIGGVDVIEIHTANIADVTELFASHLVQQADGVKVTIDANDSILLLGYKLADLLMGDFSVGP